MIFRVSQNVYSRVADFENLFRENITEKGSSIISF